MSPGNLLKWILQRCSFRGNLHDTGIFNTKKPPDTMPGTKPDLPYDRTREGKEPEPQDHLTERSLPLLMRTADLPGCPDLNKDFIFSASAPTVLFVHGAGFPLHPRQDSGPLPSLHRRSPGHGVPGDSGAPVHREKCAA